MSRCFAPDVAAANEPSPSDDPQSEASIESDAMDSRTESEADGAEIVIEELPDEMFDEFVEALVHAAVDESAAAQLSAEEWQIARVLIAGYVELLDWSLGRLLSAIHDRAGGDSIL